MKCPQCNTYTEVLETRTRADGVVRRRYLCANMHRFTTLEVVVEERKTKEKTNEL
jgi:transcriptional regulator NrdR family protein